MDIYKKKERINIILYERPIWLIFIFNSLLTMLGSSFLQESIISEDTSLEKIGRQLFLVVGCFAFMINVYFFNRNYRVFKSSLENMNSNSSLLFIRSFASLLIIFSSILIIYFQLNQSGFIDTPDVGI